MSLFSDDDAWAEKTRLRAERDEALAALRGMVEAIDAETIRQAEALPLPLRRVVLARVKAAEEPELRRARAVLKATHV